MAARIGNFILVLGCALVSGSIADQSVTRAGARPPASGSLPPTRVSPTRQPSERANCTARGGRIGVAGLAGGETCALPFHDGGRACTDRTQCTGLCLAPDGASEGGKPGVENPVVGHCQAYNYPYGCHATVDHGQLMGELCVD